MYFGSVRFFRHLILTVVFGWLGIATVLAVFFAVKCHTMSKDGGDAEAEPLTMAEHIKNMSDDGYSSVDILEYIRRNDNGAFLSVAEQALSVPANAPAAADSDNIASGEGSQENAVVITPPDEEDNAVSGTVPVSPPAENSGDTYPNMFSPTLLSSEIHEKQQVTSKTVFLTFEGEVSENTADILTIMNRQNVTGVLLVPDKALIPEQNEENRDILRWAVSQGCQVGVFAGEDMTFESKAQYMREFSAVYDRLSAVCGAPSVYRIPGSAKMSAQVREEITRELESRGFSECVSNADTDDDSGMGWQHIFDTTMENVSNNTNSGSPSVIHFGSSYSSVTAAEDIITELKDNGYSFALYRDKSDVE